MSNRIEDYALIGDMQTAALVARDGSVDWLCLPRFDSPAVFAGLLGTEENGCWKIAPLSGGHATRRTYRGDSLVLESEWETPRGTVRVIDFMPPRNGTGPAVMRIVEGVSGEVAVRSELRMRFHYGRIVPWVRRHDDGRTVAVAGPDAVWFDTAAKTYGRSLTTYSDITVREGDRISFVLTWQPSHHEPPQPLDAEEALRSAEEFWADWVQQCTYEGPWRDAVVRSLITLKALTYAPTGGIVAAPTTSLPEDIGGVRNWDYRYTWLRDAAMTLSALVRTGFLDEAKAWREWLLRAVAGDPENLQIMYGVNGERRLTEYEASWLPGYENSRPVRIGNAAAEQFQLDVYGEVVDALHHGRLAGMEGHDHAHQLQLRLMDFLESHWRNPDEGIWEVRGPRRHFVHSKVMAWVAVDRTIKMLEADGTEGPLEHLRGVRDEIHREVCEYGYDAERNTFTQYYGSIELDASLLLIPQVGFLPADDKRVVGTIEAIQHELTEDGFVRRYPTRGDGVGLDGLTGDEGAFLACSFWLADDLAMIGRVDEARELFERLLALRNDLGLLAEEWDPRLQRQVGNFPQAFSHVPLIDTALRLTSLRRLEQNGAASAAAAAESA
ncbi:glycoside hydrolase family 15 protein [Yinghuangia soli]|uniref:Trehalase n=1 Tax=Yinghuangia soli TaxID=2908204 RepID=A0AA41Q740_9ACTN|nr:glycoside hydrolase family 15 protein [Yinghuangia soli]MCF2531921.1 glycoside hydrolase family 15 protein [Yinghuangia soli]